MDKLFNMAENFMFSFNHPYVGTEHFFLAYLKNKEFKKVTFNEFKKMVIDIIGYGTISSGSVLYTPILRDIRNRIKDPDIAILEILNNDDSIVHSILVSRKVDIDSVKEEIKNMV